MNLFELFSQAMTSYMADQVDPPVMTTELDSYLTTKVIPEFQSDCFSHVSLSYSKLDRRLAYGFHFAPKHAVVWRKYLTENSNSFLRTCTRFNSIGTGPGSELVGILEASRVSPSESIEIVCLEREQEWREIFEVVLTTYSAKTGRKIAWTYTDDVRNLMPGAPVVGSCVLSELGRERQITKFLAAIRENVGTVRGRFLDFPSFPRAIRPSTLKT